LANYDLVDETEFDGEDEWLVDDDADMLENSGLDEDGTANSDVLMSAKQNNLAAQLLI
jgi:hypothetical protein